VVINFTASHVRLAASHDACSRRPDQGASVAGGQQYGNAWLHVRSRAAAAASSKEYSLNSHLCGIFRASSRNFRPALASCQILVHTAVPAGRDKNICGCGVCQTSMVAISFALLLGITLSSLAIKSWPVAPLQELKPTPGTGTTEIRGAATRTARR